MTVKLKTLLLAVLFAVPGLVVAALNAVCDACDDCHCDAPCCD